MAEEYSVHAYGYKIIDKAKSLSMRGLYKFKINHEMAADSNMFDEMTILGMDSCGSNFQTLIQNVAEVSRKVSGGWINSIISFYNNDVFKHDKGSSYKQIQAMSEKAQQVVLAYKAIAISFGDIATWLKKSYVDAEGNKSLIDSLKQSIADAEQNTAYGKDLEQLPDEYDYAADKDVVKQEMDRIIKSYYSSGSDDQKILIIADNAGDLIETIQKIQIVVNDVAEYFSTQSNLFMSTTRALVGSIGFYKPGAVQSVVRQNSTTTSWAEVESAFISFGADLYSVIQLFEFETNVKPDPPQDFKFTKLNLTLSLPDSVAIQEFMENHGLN